jgi:hypothetical protein
MEGKDQHRLNALVWTLAKLDIRAEFWLEFVGRLIELHQELRQNYNNNINTKGGKNEQRYYKFPL